MMIRSLVGLGVLIVVIGVLALSCSEGLVLVTLGARFAMDEVQGSLGAGRVIFD